MNNVFALIIMLASIACTAQPDHPEVTEVYLDIPKVETGDPGVPPSDAVVLFDGTSTEAWVHAPSGIPGKLSDWKPNILNPETPANDAIKWPVENGELVVGPGTGDIMTKVPFGSMQLHIEWLAPVDEGKEGQGYSNSGIFLMGLYEIQVLNSYDSDTYANGQAGAMYKQKAPLVNASRPPGTWQTYDIIFNAPVFGTSGDMVRPATVTVIHNGVLIQNNSAYLGPTLYIGTSYYVPHADRLPLRLQDHGNKVRYRNIWVRPL